VREAEIARDVIEKWHFEQRNLLENERGQRRQIKGRKDAKRARFIPGEGRVRLARKGKQLGERERDEDGRGLPGGEDLSLARGCLRPLLARRASGREHGRGVDEGIPRREMERTISCDAESFPRARQSSLNADGTSGPSLVVLVLIPPFLPQAHAVAVAGRGGWKG